MLCAVKDVFLDAYVDELCWINVEFKNISIMFVNKSTRYIKSTSFICYLVIWLFGHELVRCRSTCIGR